MTPIKTRQHAGTDRTTYNWADVPRQLIADAIAKGRAQTPPISLKWKLIELLTAWVNEPPPRRP